MPHPLVPENPSCGRAPAGRGPARWRHRIGPVCPASLPGGAAIAAIALVAPVGLDQLAPACSHGKAPARHPVQHLLDRGRPRDGASKAVTSLNRNNVGMRKWFRKGYSAGATAGAFSLSTALTRTAIAAVATTKPSAITAVIERTSPKPPLLYGTATT